MPREDRVALCGQGIQAGGRRRGSSRRRDVALVAPSVTVSRFTSLSSLAPLCPRIPVLSKTSGHPQKRNPVAPQASHATLAHP